MAKNPNKIRAKRVASDYVIDIIMIVTIVLVLGRLNNYIRFYL